MESTQSIFVKALEHDKYTEATQLYLARWQKLKQSGADDEKIYKGLLNGAAAVDLILKGKYKAAKKVWKVYEKYRPFINENAQHYPALKKADDILIGLKRKYKKVFDPQKYEN